MELKRHKVRLFATMSKNTWSINQQQQQQQQQQVGRQAGSNRQVSGMQ